jgi:RNA polymerase sigma-70 factor (ECF subfamily)
MKDKNKIYESLVEVYYKDLYRYSVWLTGNQSTAEDILQDAFLKAWNKLETLEDLSKAKSWLITIIRRENFRRIDKIKETEEFTDESFAIENYVENNIKIIELRKNINKLPLKYKEPLILQIIEGFTIKEISKILDINENTALTNIFRAKKQLKENMTDIKDKQWTI